MKKYFFSLIACLMSSFAFANSSSTFEDEYFLFLNQSHFNEVLSPFELTDTGVRLKEGVDIQDVHQKQLIHKDDQINQ